MCFLPPPPMSGSSDPLKIQTPQRRETGLPPTAQFTPRQLSISRWKCDTVRERGDAGVGVVTADMISGARAGDGDAFREGPEPYRLAGKGHCARTLGSFQERELAA